MRREIKPLDDGRAIRARIRVPGSKSITHRALMMAALADGECRIRHPLRSEDTQLTAGALEQLGVELQWRDREILVKPPSVRWQTPDAAIWLGNSGTTVRLLTALIAAGHGRFVLDGSQRLRERPLGPILETLEGQGLQVFHRVRRGYLPVELTAHGLQGGSMEVDASSSSQFLSAMLFTAPLARREVTVAWKRPVASFPYVEITLAMMETFGIRMERRGDAVRVAAPQRYRAFDYEVEGDCSTASYFWAAAAVTGGEVFTYPLTEQTYQGDCRFLGVLEKMGCRIQWADDGVRVTGPAGLTAVDVDMNKMPDMVPTLAAVAAFARGRTTIRNVAHLRIKESDRLQAMASELGKLGGVIHETSDGLVIEGGPLRGSLVQGHDDHRIVMALAVAGLRVPGVVIDGAEAVAKSHPGFWKALETLG